MRDNFVERLCVAVASSDAEDPAIRSLVERAMADTIGVAAAGFAEPAAYKAQAAYDGGEAKTWSGALCESVEAAITINAIAAHALDFDDIFLDSMAHASAVILPAILSESVDIDLKELLAAFAAGLTAARAVAKRVGQGHYRKGWHGTGTIGAFAAAAAVGRLKRLDHGQLRSAFSLAAAQSGGLQANFGTDAKPAQAGFAAAAGHRAARLAKAGMGGAADVFGPGGYADIYGAGDGDTEFEADWFVPRPDRISLKLYPCCYAGHRLIGAALDCRKTAAVALGDPGVCVTFTVPAGSVSVLKYDRPTTSLEAKFSAPFATAVALADGAPTLEHFTADAIHRPDLVALMERIAVREDPAQESGGDIAAGAVTLEIADATGSAVARSVRHAIPGSPEDPPRRSALSAKLTACLAVYADRFGRAFPLLERFDGVDAITGWFDHCRPPSQSERGRL